MACLEADNVPEDRSKEVVAHLNDPQIIIQFVDPDNNNVGTEMNVPLSITSGLLDTLLNKILENEERRPYSFSLTDYQFEQVQQSLESLVTQLKISSEKCLRISFYPLAVFRVRPVSRCSASLPGHSEAVLSVTFSPNGSRLATGSGDTTVRLWDLQTKSPHYTCEGHTNWVLCVAWAPYGDVFASAGMDKVIRVWNGIDGSAIGVPLQGHTKAVTCLAWQPLHLVDVADKDMCCKLASGSADGTVRIWDVVTGATLVSLTSHTDFIAAVRWSGYAGTGGWGFVYTASRDTTIKVWDPAEGKLVRTLSGHGHWVNHLALSTDHVLRTGAFDVREGTPSPKNVGECKREAIRRYQNVLQECGAERMISCSDDLTMFLWVPSIGTKAVARLTGHQKVINHVSFSSDGRLIASASFDKTIRLWNGLNGRYVACLRGHVGSVYMASWSADSRLLVSCSADSTVKLWETYKAFKLHTDLPGHADEVYTVDWSPDGSRVASGSKDRMMKIWEY